MRVAGLAGLEAPAVTQDAVAPGEGADPVTDEAPAETAGAAEPADDAEPEEPPAPRRPRRRPGAPLGPVPVIGARSFLGIGRIDVLWIVALFVIAMTIRAASPIFPDWLSHPFSGAPVTVSGLGFPYNQSGSETVFVGDNTVFPVGSRCGSTPESAAQAKQSHSETLCGFVFDEVYFPVDASYDLEQPAHDYFDPEPPLAKILMGPAIQYIGFQPWSWRLTCAIFGSLLCSLVYLIALRLRRDRFFAAAAGIFMAVDGLAIVESRTGVIDIIAVFFAVAALYAFLLHWQARTRRQWTATLYMFALTLGLAFGAKLTALSPLVVAVALVAGRYLEPVALRAVPALRRVAGPGAGEALMWRSAVGRRAFIHYPLAGVLAVAVFAACYSRYLTIDHSVPNFASCSPQTNLVADANNPSTLLQHPTLSQDGRTGASASLPQRIGWLFTDSAAAIVQHTRSSLKYHSVECRDHPYASRWYTWPGLAHPVLFYADYTSFTSQNGASEVGFISNLGNPAMWWLAIPALLFCMWAMTRGPVGFRFSVLALLSVAIALLVIVFHGLEQPAVTVTSGSSTSTFIVPIPGDWTLRFAEGLMVLAGIAVVGCAVIARRFAPAVIVLALLVGWLMWMPGNQDRVLFLYHMLGALPFIALGLAYALAAIRGVVIGAGTRYAVSLRPVAWAGVALVIAAFVFFYPIWTGAPSSQADHQMRMWFEAWYSGWS
jgi:dolichyl-phosphate-mannose-protein mannosyltransferase